jgi:hypothetical protein
MRHTSVELAAIARESGGMILDASRFSATEICAIAGEAGNHGGIVILRNVKFSAVECACIARDGKGKVVFDFSAD